MSYNMVTRYINTTDLLTAAKIRIEEKKLIDKDKYKILMYGIKEAETEDERDMCLDIVQEMIEKFNKIVDEKFKEKEIELTSI